MPFEEEAEAAAQAELLEKWKVARANETTAAPEEVQTEEPMETAGGDGEHLNGTEEVPAKIGNEHKRSFVAHVATPSQKEVEAALLARKKQKLLEKYVSEDLAKEELHVKTMLGIEKGPDTRSKPT